MAATKGQDVYKRQVVFFASITLALTLRVTWCQVNDEILNTNVIKRLTPTVIVNQLFHVLDIFTPHIGTERDNSFHEQICYIFQLTSIVSFLRISFEVSPYHFYRIILAVVWWEANHFKFKLCCFGIN